MADKSNQEILNGLMRDLKRAAELGLIPADGAQISARGEFIVKPSNIEDAENEKMRRYRFQDYPKHLHGWGIDEANPEAGEGPLFVEVLSKEEEENAIAAGWSPVALHGPKGLLTGDESESAPPVEDVKPKGPVRTFAPPGSLSGRKKAPAAPKSDDDKNPAKAAAEKADKPAGKGKGKKAPAAPKGDDDKKPEA